MPGKKKNGATQTAPKEIALKEEVREALLTILREPESAASARASAARSLLEFFGEERHAPSAPAEELTELELDREIARLEVGKR